MSFDWGRAQEIMKRFHAGPAGVAAADAASAAAGQNFPLSGGPGAFQYRPAPAPAMPFMPQPQVGPQTIARGGNLGLPSNGFPQGLQIGDAVRGLFPGGVVPPRTISAGLPMTQGAMPVLRRANLGFGMMR